MKISQKAIPGELFVLNEFKVAVISEKVFFGDFRVPLKTLFLWDK